jgi:CO/xanthine dehydrogenase Mo-binding subunit
MPLPTLTRRAFLEAGGCLIVTFSVRGLVPRALAAAPPAAPAPKTVAADEVDGFLAIGPDGKVTVYSGKVDLGTGVRTAIAQIAAEELEVPLAAVEVVQGDTALTPDQGPTSGSLSIQNGGMQVRQAAATAREALLADGAKRLGLSREDVAASAGSVAARSGSQKISYAALVGGKRLSLKVDAKAPLKDPSSYTIVGKPVPRLDIPAKVTGRFTYVHDLEVPGMVHARVVRPAAMKASLASVDDAAARKIPGFVATVRKGNFLAVVARSEWGAIRAAEAVRATWSDWSGLPEQAALWEHVRGGAVAKDEVVQSAGDSGAALKSAARTLRATYDFAIHTHGSIGPSCAVAEYRDGKLTCWTASQATHLLCSQLAYSLGMKAQDIRCVYVDGAGCYGRNGHEDAATDAAIIAREVGKPVRVQWSRADEHGWDPKGPPTLIDYRGAVDAEGKLVAWESEAFMPRLPEKSNSSTLLGAELAGLPTSPAHPGNLHRCLPVPYEVPNSKVTVHWLAETPFRPSWIRTPGRLQTTFGNESFLDECAAAAEVDPLEFRRRILKDPRGLEVLDRLAKLARWTPRPRREAGAGGDVVTGRGVSYVKYDLARTYVGAVADVEVNLRTGAVRVTRMYVAHDCGQIINPDGVRNQIEGGVIQTVSRTLVEELKFDRHKVTSVDWASYPILEFPDVPEIVIDLVDRPREKPWGAGEPAATVVPSAIGNAIWDAAGVRLRSVPFTPAKVLGALKQV